MRSEEEVKQMVEELNRIDSPHGKMTARAVRAALENVLDGPADTGWCACLGPAGCCICMMRGLASGKAKP